MMARILMLYVLLLVAIAPAAIGQESKPPTDVEIRESKVFDAIGEMIERRDKLLKQFAVVLHGELVSTSQDDDPIRTTPLIMARVVSEKRRFDLRASYTVLHGKHELGREVVRQGDRYKERTHKMFTGDYHEKPKGQKLSNWLHYSGTNPGGLDPFDDYVSGADAITHSLGANSLELLLKKEIELVRTERGTGNALVSHWQRSIPHISTEMTITFDPAQEMMPVKFAKSIQQYPHYFEEVAYQWSRHKSTLVPTKINMQRSEISDPDSTASYTLKCHWLIGDDVPNEIFTAKDHLAALLDQFDIPHSYVEGGQVIRVQQEPPADLYKTETRVGKK